MDIDAFDEKQLRRLIDHAAQALATHLRAPLPPRPPRGAEPHVEPSAVELIADALTDGDYGDAHGVGGGLFEIAAAIDRLAEALANVERE